MGAMKVAEAWAMDFLQYPISCIEKQSDEYERRI